MQKIKDVIISERTQGMIEASADYYQESELFFYLMNAKALGYDFINAKLYDLALQRSPLTATWGLKYWEQSVALPMRDSTDYEKRRPPILARLFNYENFSAEMVRRIAEAYGNTVDVTIDPGDCLVTVTFLNDMPYDLVGLKKDIERIIHAHLGLKFTVRYDWSLFYGVMTCITPNVVIDMEEINKEILTERVTMVHVMNKVIVLT